MVEILLTYLTQYTHPRISAIITLVGFLPDILIILVYQFYFEYKKRKATYILKGCNSYKSYSTVTIGEILAQYEIDDISAVNQEMMVIEKNSEVKGVLICLTSLLQPWRT
ncbi:hypothetical protein HB901_12510 [Listeria booriae]|uniref:hypothetical protein n=1 Tax=Listeria booriae TaxID=1552123 RepID=UPI001627A5A4|nr:hypothetical protein [Listeria booriae]MBC1553540.1 hypothetical protein [Listeria booriae]